MATNRQPFSGRRSERATLARLLSSDKSEFVAVYGRRRVGKTFLIRRFFADEPVVYFEMVGRCEGSLDDHLQIFTESLSQAFYRGAPLAPPHDWHGAFRALEEAIEATPGKKRKFVLFFDELPWIATHRSGLLRELEHFWNAWCTRRDDIVLVVCGSAASWMLRRIVHAKGGLHNRLTQTIRLLPFTLAEVGQFLADRNVRVTNRDLVELYMIFGGVPHYLDHVGRGHSVAQLVDRICLEKDGALAGELDRLFASLFADDEKYMAVVRALAEKRHGLTRGELLEAAKLPSGGGSTTLLENLEEGGFISSTIPFSRTSRDRLLRLTDNFVLFSLHWLRGRRPRSWQHVRGSPRWRAWAGLAFEDVCLANVDAVARALGISGVETYPSAWAGPGAQIDLLIDRADNVISVCEVKFTDEPFVITKRYAEDLRNKLGAFRSSTGTRKTLQLVFVTSTGLNDNAHSRELVDRAVTLDDLLA